MSQELKNIIEAQIPDNEERLIKPKNVRDTLDAIVDELDEKTYNFNELEGAVGNTQLSGTYSSASIKTNGSNTVFSMPGSGSTSFQARTVVNLCELRTSISNTVGALVFVAPNTNRAMFQLDIDVHLFDPTVGQATKLIVQGYVNVSFAFENLRKIQIGTIDIPVRVALKSNKLCVILGNIDSIWRYPHVVISLAKFSHLSEPIDDYCKGWSSEIVTDLGAYTNISPYLPNYDLVGSAINTSSAKTTPVDADTVPLLDSAASNILKKLTWANIKSTLTSVFLPLAGGVISGNIRFNGGIAIGRDPELTGGLYFHRDNGNPFIHLSGGDSGSPTALAQVRAEQSNNRVGFANGAASMGFWLNYSEQRAYVINHPTTSMGVATKGYVDTTIDASIGSMANRDVTISESAPSGGVDGDIWLQV